jgi:hypothetical protein
MPTLYFIYIAILIIFTLSLILTFIDWISLRSLSTKISNLELEIEKKAQEFDNFKKERASSQTQDIQNGKIENSSQAYSTNQNIEIVRNVRGNFESTEPTDFNPQEQITKDGLSESQTKEILSGIGYNETQQMPKKANYSKEPQEQSKLTEGNTPFNQNINTPIYSDVSEFNNVEPVPQTESNDSDIMDVVGDNQAQDLIYEPIVFHLYSDTIKDADFAKLWNMTTDLLSNGSAPNLAIDFAGIDFIYEKELGYLEKILQIISHQKGSLVFYNCGDELASLIMKRPSLAPLIKQNII